MPRHRESDVEVFGTSFVDVIIGSSVGMIVVTLIFSSLAGGGGLRLIPLRLEDVQEQSEEAIELPFVFFVEILADPLTVVTPPNPSPNGWGYSKLERESPGERQFAFVVEGQFSLGEPLEIPFKVNSKSPSPPSSEWRILLASANELEHRKNLMSAEPDKSYRRQLDGVEGRLSSIKSVVMRTGDCLMGIPLCLNSMRPEDLNVPPAVFENIKDSTHNPPSPAMGARFQFFSPHAKGGTTHWITIPSETENDGSFTLKFMIQTKSVSTARVVNTVLEAS